MADSDMLFDQIGPVAQSHNFALAMNMIDEAAGDSDLMEVRARGSSVRPFTKLNEIREEANKKISDEFNKTQEELNKVASEISTAKSNKERNLAMMNTFREAEKKQRELGKKKWDLEKQAKKEYDGIVQSMKAWTVVLPLVLILIAGLVVFIIRKINTAAQ